MDRNSDASREVPVEAKITKVYLDFKKVFVKNEFGVTSTLFAASVREEVQTVTAVKRNVAVRSIAVFELFPYLKQDEARFELKKFVFYNVFITATRAVKLFFRSVFYICGAVEHIALCAKRYISGDEFDLHPIIAHIVFGVNELMFSIKAPMSGVVLMTIALYGLISDPIFAAAAINMVEIKANVDLPSSSARSIFDTSSLKRDCSHIICIDPEYTIDKTCKYKDQILDVVKDSIHIANINSSAKDIITTSLEFGTENELYYSTDITGYVATKLGQGSIPSPYRYLPQKNELLKSTFDEFYGDIPILDSYAPFTSYGRVQSNHISTADA